MKTGIIYMIGGSYIGQTTTQNLEARMRQHKKSGKDVEGLQVIHSGLSADRINDAEAYYIGYFNTFMDGENKTRGNSLELYSRGLTDKETREHPFYDDTIPVFSPKVLSDRRQYLKSRRKQSPAQILKKVRHDEKELFAKALLLFTKESRITIHRGSVGADMFKALNIMVEEGLLAVVGMMRQGTKTVKILELPNH